MADEPFDCADQRWIVSQQPLGKRKHFKFVANPRADGVGLYVTNPVWRNISAQSTDDIGERLEAHGEAGGPIADMTGDCADYRAVSSARRRAKHDCTTTSARHITVSKAIEGP